VVLNSGERQFYAESPDAWGSADRARTFWRQGASLGTRQCLPALRRGLHSGAVCDLTQFVRRFDLRESLSATLEFLVETNGPLLHLAVGVFTPSDEQEIASPGHPSMSLLRVESDAEKEGRTTIAR